MSIHPRGHVGETASQDWEIVPTDWWRTHYSNVSWVYIQDPPQDKKFQRRQFQGSLFPSSLPKNQPRQRPPLPSRSRAAGLAASINLDLVGVKAALDAVVAYENSVGFYHQTFPKIEPDELESLIALRLSSRSIKVDDTRVHQTRWNELVADLMHSPLPDSSSESDHASELGASSVDSLRHSTSTLSSVDLTSSEGSLESQPMPSTPRAKLAFHHPIEVKDSSPTGSVRISHIRSLSALASSFIPTLSSHASSNDDPINFPLLQDSPSKPSFSDFVFPSLNPTTSISTASAPLKLKKDSDGFFTDDSTNSTPTSLLPSFLQDSSHRNVRTRKSRTREIVDRLKSELVTDEERSTNTHKARHVISKYASYSPSPQLLDDFTLTRRSVSEDGSGEQREHRTTMSTSLSASVSAETSRLSTPEVEDDDGWIDIADPTTSSFPKEKSKRTRELFLALTRRRTDSMSSEVAKEMKRQTTGQSSEGAVVEGVVDIPTSSTPSTPPGTDATWSISNSPSIVRTGTVTSSDGWIENTLRVPEQSSQVQQKETISKKESHFRKKSHNGHSNGVSTWVRSPTFQSVPPMPPHLLPRTASLPLSSFPPPTTLTHVLPTSTTTSTNPGGMPYFFPTYPNLPMSVRIPSISPVNYNAATAAYNAMHVRNAYHMPPPLPPVQLQSYMPSTPLTQHFSGMTSGGYAAPRATAMTTAQKFSGFTSGYSGSSTVPETSFTMPVPVGATYGGLNGNKGKW